MGNAPQRAPARSPEGNREPGESLGRDTGILAETVTPSKTGNAPGLGTLAVLGSHVGVSRTTADAWDRAELLPAPSVIRGRRYWSMAELSAWMLHGCPARKAWARQGPRIRRELLISEQTR